jgi:hypothetical protein
VIRGLVGVALALAGLVPLGAGVLFLTRTPFRVGLAVFTGMAAAMVLLPPLVYLGLSPSVPVVLALGALALVVGVLLGDRAGADCVRPLRCSCSLRRSSCSRRVPRSRRSVTPSRTGF